MANLLLETHGGRGKGVLQKGVDTKRSDSSRVIIITIYSGDLGKEVYYDFGTGSGLPVYEKGLQWA